MQSTDHKEEGKLAEHRKLLAKVVSDKHEDTMAKMGAIIAAGLLDGTPLTVTGADVAANVGATRSADVNVIRAPSAPLKPTESGAPSAHVRALPTVRPSGRPLRCRRAHRPRRGP